MTFAEELAERAKSLKRADLPDEAVRVAKRAIADTVGVGLAGSQLDFTATVKEAVAAEDGPGDSTVFGQHARCSPLQAALMNGICVHALDFDDCSTTLCGHPSAPIVPTLLALGEVLQASGAAILEAYISGFETETHLARAVMPQHYEVGWHPTSTLGIFGAAAAAGRLLDLDTDRIAMAFAISTSLASGLKANFATPVKPLQVGQAAQSGLLAALLAARGLNANAGAFEHDQGFLKLFNSPTGAQPEKALSDWREDLDILAPGIAVKQHPCCGSTHSAIDAAIQLHRRHGPLDPSSVRQIEITVHARRLTHTNRPRPQSALDAKFSVQFVTAKALRSGAIRLGDFKSNAFLSPDVARLMACTETYAHHSADEYEAKLRLYLADGTIREASASTRLGRGPENPLSESEFAGKFIECASPAIDAAKAALLLSALLDLEQIPDIREVTPLLRGREEEEQDPAEADRLVGPHPGGEHGHRDSHRQQAPTEAATPLTGPDP